MCVVLISHLFSSRYYAGTACLGLVITGRWTGREQKSTWLLPTGESAVKEMAMSAAWAGMRSPGVCTAPTLNTHLCTVIRAKTLQVQFHLVLGSTWIMEQEHLHFTMSLMACSFCTESRLHSQSPSTLHSVCGALVLL